MIARPPAIVIVPLSYHPSVFPPPFLVMRMSSSILCYALQCCTTFFVSHPLGRPVLQISVLLFIFTLLCPFVCRATAKY